MFENYYLHTIVQWLEIMWMCKYEDGDCRRRDENPEQQTHNAVAGEGVSEAHRWKMWGRRRGWTTFTNTSSHIVFVCSHQCNVYALILAVETFLFFFVNKRSHWYLYCCLGNTTVFGIKGMCTWNEIGTKHTLLITRKYPTK